MKKIVLIDVEELGKRNASASHQAAGRPENDNTKPLADLLPNGDTYQNGVKPGDRKLDQFRTVLALRQTPALYANEGKGMELLATVKLFDPCSQWTWYIFEWDGDQRAFGLVVGFEAELGTIDLRELATARGALGIEIDMHWTPRSLKDCSPDS